MAVLLTYRKVMARVIARVMAMVGDRGLDRVLLLWKEEVTGRLGKKEEISGRMTKKKKSLDRYLKIMKKTLWMINLLQQLLLLYLVCYVSCLVIMHTMINR